MHKLKEKLMDELYEYEEKAKKAPDGKIGVGDLQAIHMITDTVKNIEKIEMLGESDHSERGRWEAVGDYDDGDSYARRRMHYVRGHYSRDGRETGMHDRMHDDGMSYDARRRDNMGRYSRESGKEHMIEKLEDMMDNTEDRGRKEIIRKCVEQLERT